MKINYGLWWEEVVNGKRKRRNQNFSIEHDMNWDNEEEHIKFRQMIVEKHPGTHIIGYALEDESND